MVSEIIMWHKIPSVCWISSSLLHSRLTMWYCGGSVIVFKTTLARHNDSGFWGPLVPSLVQNQTALPQINWLIDCVLFSTLRFSPWRSAPNQSEPVHNCASSQTFQQTAKARRAFEQFCGLAKETLLPKKRSWEERKKQRIRFHSINTWKKGLISHSIREM